MPSPTSTAGWPVRPEGPDPRPRPISRAAAPPAPPSPREDHLDRRRQSDRVRHVADPQRRLEQRAHHAGGRARGDPELQRAEPRPVVDPGRGDRQVRQRNAALARRPAQGQRVARGHRGQQVLGRHRSGTRAARLRRLVHDQVEPGRRDAAPPAALPYGDHRSRVHSVCLHVGRHRRCPRERAGRHPARGGQTVQVLIWKAPARHAARAESSTSSGLKGFTPSIRSSSRNPYRAPIAKRQA